MAGVLRYQRTDGHGRSRPGLVLTDARLIVWHGGRPRELRWSEILAARWTDDQQAELELIGGEVVELAGIDRLDEAIAAIDQRAMAARTAAQRSPRLPDGAKAYFRRRLWRRIWRAVVISACVSLAVLAFLVLQTGGQGMPFVWVFSGAVFAVQVLAHLVSLVRVTAGGLLTFGGDHFLWHRLPWSAIVDTGTVRREHRYKQSDSFYLSIETRDGEVEFLTHDRADVHLIEEFVLARRQWRAADFRRAGTRPPPDNALSLARLSEEPGAERGLSQLRSGADE